MWRLRRLSLISCAIGLPLTNVVSTFTGRPRYDETLATFVSALDTCIRNVPPQCTGWPAGGVMRMPMLVGTTRAYLQFGLREMLIGTSFVFLRSNSAARQ